VSTTAACGCCAGIEQRTPLSVLNRPGLSAIAYRTGVHADFLASMVAGLTDASRPGLAALRTRDPDDFAIALLDAWALAADTLTFYSERLAQESYLRTARERVSLQELGRLIGYRLRPGAAARTSLAFALQRPPAPPPAATSDPGSAPPVTPASVTLEPGLRVQSIPGPGEQPQTFETVEAIEARPEWSAIAPRQTAPQVFATDTGKAYLKGAALNLRPGDELLLAGSTWASELRWSARELQSVTPDAAAGRTLVTWDQDPSDWAVADLLAVQPYVFRKRLDVFGHNAPYWLGMSKTFRAEYGLGKHAHDHEWPGFVITGLTGTAVDLDGSHPDVLPGSWILLTLGQSRQLWRVGLVAEGSRAEFAVSGKVTVLSLKDGAGYDTFHGHVRSTKVLAVSEPLELADAPDQSPVAGGSLEVAGDVDLTGMKAGRRLIVVGTTVGGAGQVEEAALKADAAGQLLVLEQPLAGTYRRDGVLVFGNVALATHGETVHQILGSGSASSSFQRFDLAHGPLTYVESPADPSGVETTLSVRVNDASWTEAPTLFGAAPAGRAYAVRTDEAGATYVQFGDGVRGARLPSGVNNVRATYRTGIGAAGNVRAGGLAQLLDRPLGARGVSNPSAATGGVDPESETAARTSIPLGVRTLGRAVSLLDYEDYARAFTGVVKAKAATLTLRATRTVVVTVLFASGDRSGDLWASLRSHGDPEVQVLVLDGTIERFRLGLRFARDPAADAAVVRAGVRVAVQAAFGFDARDLVQPVHLSEIEAAVHTVPGVAGVEVGRLYRSDLGAGFHDRLLAQQPSVDAAGAALPAGLLVAEDDPFDWLEELK
jgi:predicted phage baseplate assembly protein